MNTRAPGASPHRGVLAPGLAKLLSLRLRATRRETGRRLRTPGGLAMAVLGVIVVGGILWIRATLPVPAMMPQRTLEGGGTYFLLGVFVLQLLARGGGDVLGFMPAEADQLFGAPFRPGELLRYKVILLVVALLSSAVLVAPFLLLYGRRLDTTMVSIALVMTMVQLAAMAAAMAIRVSRRTRWIAGILLGAGLVGLGLRFGVHGMSAAELQELGDAIRLHPVGQVVLYPFWCGAALLAATSWSEAWIPALSLLGVNAALVGVLLLLGEGSWIELAQDGAQHIGARVGSVRSGSWLGATDVRMLRLPPFPRLWGVGLLARRQVAEILRRPLVLVLPAFFGLMLLVPVALAARSASDPQAQASLAITLPGMLAPMLVMVQSFLPSMLRTDFRGDLERLDLLLGLPIPRWALLVGQVLPGAALLVSLVAPAVIVLAVALGPWAAGALALLAVQPLVAFWQLLVENVVFLWLPHRIEMGEAALEALGKGALNYLLSQAITWSLVGVALGLGVAGWMLSDRSLLVGVVLADGTLAVGSAVALAAGAWRLRHFDPTVHLR